MQTSKILYSPKSTINLQFFIFLFEIPLMNSSFKLDGSKAARNANVLICTMRDSTNIFLLHANIHLQHNFFVSKSYAYSKVCIVGILCKPICVNFYMNCDANKKVMEKNIADKFEVSYLVKFYMR